MTNTTLVPTVGSAVVAGVAAGNWPSSALLSITEFSSLHDDHTSGSALPRCPPTAIQQVAYGAFPGLSVAFQANTRLIRVIANGVCALVIGGKTPAATTASMRVTANTAELYAVTPADKLSVIVTT